MVVGCGVCCSIMGRGLAGDSGKNAGSAGFRRAGPRSATVAACEPGPAVRPCRLGVWLVANQCRWYSVMDQAVVVVSAG